MSAALVTIVSGYPIFSAGLNSVQKQKKATDDTLDQHRRDRDAAHGREHHGPERGLADQSGAAARSHHAQAFANCHQRSHGHLAQRGVETAPKPQARRGRGVRKGRFAPRFPLRESPARRQDRRWQGSDQRGVHHGRVDSRAKRPWATPSMRGPWSSPGTSTSRSPISCTIPSWPE